MFQSGYPCSDGCLLDVSGYSLWYLLVEDTRNDIILTQFFICNHLGYGIGCSEQHLIIDLSCLTVQDSPEKTGEAEDVIDLIGII